MDGTTAFTQGICDGDAWREWQARPKENEFRDDPAGPEPTWFTRFNVWEVAFILFDDAWQPFKNTSYSSTVWLLAIANLPLALQRKQENLICVALIPGVFTGCFLYDFFCVAI